MRRKFCNAGCRECYHTDRKMGLIYGSYAIPRTALTPSMAYYEHTPRYVDTVLVGWEDGCRVAGRCCYCGAQLRNISKTEGVRS